MKLNVKIFLAVIAFVLSVPVCRAQETEYRQEVKVGIGTAMFERHFYANSAAMSYVDRPAGATYLEKQRHRYIPHIYAEYFYTFKPWFSLGGQVDMGGFTWENRYFRGGSDDIVSKDKQNCFNIAVQAFARFNWLRKKYISLYSGIGTGVAVNTGTEVDPYGHKTLVGIALTPVPIGISAGKGHWFGSVEISGLNSLKSKDQMFLLGARLVSISGGYRF